MPHRWSARAAWLPFAAALGLRVALLALQGDPLQLAGKDTAWDWGYEQAAVAQAVARGDGFADAFARGTGPTGWSAPLYPALVALLIVLFGGVDRAMATALALVQALFSAATAPALGRLGAELGGARIGRFAAWAWALHPAAIYYAVNLPWDSTLTAFGTTVFLAALVARREAGPRSALLLGAGFGALLLVNPSPIALLPIALLWLRPVRSGLLFALAAALVVAPWMARNALVVGSAGIRTNLGVELFVGNNDGAEGQFNGALHPAYDAAERARYAELGEAAYAADAGVRARAWIRAHPGRFARLTAVRVARFWFGRSPFAGVPLGDGSVRQRDALGWVKWGTHALVGVLALIGAVSIRGRGAWVLRGLVLLFPLVYYVTHVFERYRLPIEPVLTLLAVWVVLRAADLYSDRRL